MMKFSAINILIVITLIGIDYALAQDSESEGINISVIVDRVSSEEGRVLFSLHSKKTWLKGPGVMNAAADIVDGRSETVFDNVPPGTYAIMVMHDKNNNDDMDVNKIGLPKEDYGSSRNPAKLGPPSFGASKFKVKKEDLSFEIHL